MKTSSKIRLLLVAAILAITSEAIAQADSTKIEEGKMYIVFTNGGGEFVGKILRNDAREILIKTQDRGEVIIPKYEVKAIKEVRAGDLSSSGEFIPEQIFSTRYFLTTNGLPIEKGESYILWNLWGPDFQFGVAKNVSVGVLTSWIGIPIIGSVKYSMQLSEKASLGVGTLLGTGSWAAPEFGIALPFGALTLGNRRSNINVSAGYGAIWGDGGSSGKALLSIAGMTKMTRSSSFVFETFIVPNSGGEFGTGTSALILPGFRLQSKDDRAFQFGFAGAVADGELVPVPIPFVQWFRKF